MTNEPNDLSRHGTARHGTARHGTARHGTARHGGITIAICTRNRASILKQCLESIAQITADKSLFGVIVVNNNSTDNTEQVCKTFAEANPDITFRHVIESNVGYSTVRNRAIAEVKSELLSFVDDDATVLPNYIDAILETFAEYPAYSVAGGKITPVFENGIEPKYLCRFLNPFVKVDLGEVAKPFPSKVGFKYAAIKFPPTCNIVFRTEVFARCGNFDDVGRGEDAYMASKLRKNKEKILYAPKIMVHHHIAKERCQRKNLMDMGYYSGKSLAIWLKAKGSKKQRAFTLADRILKFAFAVCAGTFYCITLRPVTGWYLISYNYNMAKGYIAHC